MYEFDVTYSADLFYSCTHIRWSILNRFLEATVNGLSESQPACIRISSVRASYYYCENLILNQQAEILSPALPLLYEGTMSIAQAYGTEVLTLSLDSMEIALKVCARVESCSLFIKLTLDSV